MSFKNETSSIKNWDTTNVSLSILGDAKQVTKHTHVNLLLKNA